MPACLLAYLPAACCRDRHCALISCSPSTVVDFSPSALGYTRARSTANEVDGPLPSDTDD
jgi:hypothetical protein